MSAPAHSTFRIHNWFVWIIEASKLGYSEADIRWILRTIGVWDEIVARVKTWEEKNDAQTR